MIVGLLLLVGKKLLLRQLPITTNLTSIQSRLKLSLIVAGLKTEKMTSTIDQRKKFKLYDLNGEGDGMVLGETFNFGDGRSVNTYDNSTEVTLKEKGYNGYKLIETENVLHYQEFSKYDLTLEGNGAEYKLKYSVDVEQVPPKV
ncbi:MAG: hypothetical protein BRC40_06570 [Cyanobacteria bacterium QH_8_48_120]|nr:MAG: hypothetical protein BRC40_06570 [Cyanobacteria bacterium QH_8_48_120]